MMKRAPWKAQRQYGVKWRKDISVNNHGRQKVIHARRMLKVIGQRK
jgi:hypothetical protein